MKTIKFLGGLCFLLGIGWSCNTADDVTKETVLPGNLLELTIDESYNPVEGRKEYVYLTDENGSLISDVFEVRAGEAFVVPRPNDYRVEDFTLNQVLVLQDEGSGSEYYYVYSWTQFPTAALTYADIPDEGSNEKNFQVRVEEVEDINAYGASSADMDAASNYVTFDFFSDENRPAFAWFQAPDRTRKFLYLDSAQNGGNYTYTYAELPELESVSATLSGTQSIQNYSIWTEGYSQDYQKSITYMSEFFLGDLPPSQQLYYDEGLMANNRSIFFGSDAENSYLHISAISGQELSLEFWDSGAEITPLPRGVDIELPADQATYMYSTFRYNTGSAEANEGSVNLSWNVYGPGESKEVQLPDMPETLIQEYPVLGEELNYTSSSFMHYNGGISTYDEFVDNYFFSDQPIEQKVSNYDQHIVYNFNNASARFRSSPESMKERMEAELEEIKLLHKVR